MRKLLAAATAGAMFLGACGGPDGSNTNPGANDGASLTVLGPNEKADDFRSESAQEYFVRGTTTIDLDEEWAEKSEDERLQRVQELIPYKQVQIGFFLNTYLIDKSDDSDNSDYGGFKALTKNGSYEDMGIKKVGELSYEFEFVQEVGGQFDLLKALSRKVNGMQNADGSYTFDLAVGELSNDEMTQLEHGREWYRRSPWSSFSTDSVDESRYYMQEVTLRQQERSDDAWIDYNRLFEDGSADIAIFFGWDYHNDYHQKHAESTYRWLVRNGYDSPADSFSDYADNRAPLTATINADGREVDVNVTLWWGEPGTETDPDTDAGGKKLEQAMRASFKTNEVTAFSGHSGPWYGFALANWRKTAEGDLDDSEIPGLEMPADKYQVVLAEGCDTYALGEAFWKNPNKSDRTNLDIITTTSFSNAGTHRAVTDFLDTVIGADRSGNHQPETYSSLLKDLDNNSFWFQTMYGVHGIDDNPHSHPYSNENALCSSCSTDADCGGTGNKCVDLQGSNVCTFECTANDGCPDGFTCRETRSNGYVRTSVCVPNNYTCEAPSEPEGPTVQFTEIMADPAPELAGDHNGDGSRDARQDEFIEVQNVSDGEIDLSGWQISDNVTVRFMFPAGSVLAPGERLVIFGGGDPDSFQGLPEGGFLSADGLYLNNSGDALVLTDHEGEEIDSMSYGREGGENRPLVRGDDGEWTAVESATPGAAN